jgi:hypothetical protein
LLALRDVLGNFERYYPLPFAALMAGGLVVHVLRSRSSPEKLVAGFVPLFVAVSFTLAFNCVARRSDHRFVLPQWLFMGIYAGIAIDGLLSARSAAARRVIVAVLVPLFAIALFRCAEVDANLVLDPRYDAESWMRDHIPAGATVETYGRNVYLPRFPAGVRVERVGPEPLEGRNPLPGVEEVQGRYARAVERRPRFIVVSDGWIWRYRLDPDWHGEAGRILSVTQQKAAADRESADYFESLLQGTNGYRLAHTAGWKSAIWPALDIHASTARSIWIYERID